MSSSTQPLVVLCTVPDRHSGVSLARQLVQSRLAACVNLIPSITSIYLWENRVLEEDEWLAIIKSYSDRYEELERQVHQLHPYDTPEIIALPITAGLNSYIDWLHRSTRDES